MAVVTFEQSVTIDEIFAIEMCMTLTMTFRMIQRQM